MQINAIKVGIIGCGQLGLSIAMQLITKGLPQESLMLSYGGNPETLKRIGSSGLTHNIATNSEIANNCDLVFITVKPSNISEMKKIPVKPETLLVSCVAGHEIKTIEAIFHHPVCKIMPTSPESIENETAICGIFPPKPELEEYLKWLGFELFILNEEAEFHYFTAMACIPAALLQLKIYKKVINEEQIFQEAKSLHFHQFKMLYNRLKMEVPLHLNDAESTLYIKKMATKGGITECIVSSIQNGATLVQAIAQGIERSREIARG